jgi:hypothetical protein
MLFDRAFPHRIEGTPQVRGFRSTDQVFEPLLKSLLVGIQDAWIDKTSFFRQ